MRPRFAACFALTILALLTDSKALPEGKPRLIVIPAEMRQKLLLPDYSWRSVPTLHLSVLQPNSWHYKEVEKNGSVSVFITKEDIDKEGSFKTGLSIWSFHSSNAAKAAKEFMKGWTEKYEASVEPLEMKAADRVFYR